MKGKFEKNAPLLRLGFAVVALSVTVSIGGFIDYLATDHVAVVAELMNGPVRTAEVKR